MNKFVKNLTILVVFAVAACGLAACAPGTESEALKASEEVSGTALPEQGAGPEEAFVQNTEYEINIAALKGPTGMGLACLNHQSDVGNTENKYSISYSAAPDEITGGLISGKTDIAAVPVNLAAVLFNKTEGDVLCFGVNTLGVLYIVEKGGTVNSLSDLEGKKLIASGQGSTPEYILDYILEKNGLRDKVSIEYVSEHDEAVTALAGGKTELVMIPEPKVTAALAQIEGARTAIDLTAEWKKVSSTELVQGVFVVRKGFIDELEEKAGLILGSFMDEYRASAAYTQTNPAEAAEIIAGYGIIPNAQIALKAIPNCNIAYMDNDEMETAVNEMLNVLYEADPKSIGGSLPGSEMYYHINSPER